MDRRTGRQPSSAGAGRPRRRATGIRDGADGPDPRPASGGAYAYQGAVRLDYAPQADGEPDPGEVVWTWVPYEEDDRLGKDRPVVVIGATDWPGHHAALLLSTRSHAGERGWVSLGAGAWDPEQRESWVRVDRILAVADGTIRREGAVLERDRFLGLLDKARREHSGEQVD